MKTIKELKNEGLISTRLYNALWKGVYFDNKFKVGYSRSNADTLTAKDVVELWTDEEILKWRGIGLAGLKELKSLV